VIQQRWRRDRAAAVFGARTGDLASGSSTGRAKRCGLCGVRQPPFLPGTASSSSRGSTVRVVCLRRSGRASARFGPCTCAVRS